MRVGCRRGIGTPLPMGALTLLLTLAGLWTPEHLQAQTILGTLLDARNDQAIMLGYVGLLTEEGERVVWTMTDEEGFFRLEAPDPGSYMLYGESLGYNASLEGPVLLGDDQVVPAEFRLEPMPLVLDSIRIVARSRRISLVLSGFYEREAAGLGHFIGPDEIMERMEARNITDFFWAVPGIRLMPQSNLAGSGYVPMMRAAAGMQGFCLPNVYLDGIPMPGADEIDQLIQPFDLEAIEVYRSPSEVPARFTTAAANCGVILLWSRKGR